MADRVLVTGATGFIGQRLVYALLRNGHQVRAMLRPGSQRAGQAAVGLGAAGAELLPGDVLDLDSLRRALDGVSAVYHLAGRLHVPGVPHAEYERLHIEGTRNVLVACAQGRPLRRIIHCSTTGVLGPADDGPLDEDAPLRPGNSYEWTKAVGEQLALVMTATHGLPISVVRPALVYGPGDLHLLGWFRAIKRGYYRVVGPGDALMHPIFIEDAVAGLARCLEAPAQVGRIYHLVGERALPIRELAAAIAGAMARRLPRSHIPLWLARASAGALEALPGVRHERLPLTRSRIDFMTTHWAYRGERAREELGFEPRVSLEAGLRQTVAWYRRLKLL
jgi:nucleoside-diphosphate-sugar epimerase